jgi:hypothetical protein
VVTEVFVNLTDDGDVAGTSCLGPAFQTRTHLMKIFIAITTVLSLTFSSTAFALAPRAYLEMSPSFWAGPPKLKVNGKTIRRRTFIPGYSFSQEMGTNTRARELAEKHEAYSMWAGISAGVALAGALTYLVSVDSDDYDSGIYFSILILGLIPSIVLNKTATAYLFGAVNAYNGIDDRYESRLSFNLVPVKEGARAGVSLSF